MIATNPTFVDGKFYDVGQELYDIGSWKARSTLGSFRDYYGLSKDVSKLPHYVATSSTAYCVDTGDIYIFEKTTDTWYLQR